MITCDDIGDFLRRYLFYLALKIWIVEIIRNKLLIFLINSKSFLDFFHSYDKYLLTACQTSGVPECTLCYNGVDEKNS